MRANAPQVNPFEVCGALCHMLVVCTQLEPPTFTQESAKQESSAGAVPSRGVVTPPRFLCVQVGGEGARDANCDVRAVLVGGWPFKAMFTTKAVKAGQQLLYDYGHVSTITATLTAQQSCIKSPPLSRVCLMTDLQKSHLACAVCCVTAGVLVCHAQGAADSGAAVV
jgi:hypothetical protein